MKNQAIYIAAMSLATVLLSGCATSASQQNNSTTAPAAKQSITDKSIQADYANYEAQQGRIKALNDTGRHRVASYSLAKAQCWLDVSLHEYTRNDRSNFPQLAFDESFKITDYLEKVAQSPLRPIRRMLPHWSTMLPNCAKICGMQPPSSKAMWAGAAPSRKQPAQKSSSCMLAMNSISSNGVMPNPMCKSLKI